VARGFDTPPVNQLARTVAKDLAAQLPESGFTEGDRAREFRHAQTRIGETRIHNGQRRIEAAKRGKRGLLEMIFRFGMVSNQPQHQCGNRGIATLPPPGRPKKEFARQFLDQHGDLRVSVEYAAQVQSGAEIAVHAG
jgi:hypothetical protein